MTARHLATVALATAALLAANACTSVNPEARKITSSHKYGIFFGTGATPEKVQRDLNGTSSGTPVIEPVTDGSTGRVFQIVQRDHTAEEGGSPALLNPFTDRPFPAAGAEDGGTLLIAPGRKNAFREALRVISATVFGHVSMDKYKDLAGRHFEYAICHSNGSTEAIKAHKAGLITVDHFIHLGSPWSNFGEQEIRGSTQFSVSNYADPIVLLGVVRTPYFLMTLPTRTHGTTMVSLDLNEPDEDASTREPSLPENPARSLSVGLAADPAGDLDLDPFRSHYLLKSYFPALQNWREQREQWLSPDRFPRTRKQAPYNLFSWFGENFTFGQSYSFRELFHEQQRIALPMLFDETVRYRGHLIQRGLFSAGSDDLAELWYVNRLPEPGEFGSEKTGPGQGSTFRDVDQAKRAIDRWRQDQPQ